MSLSGGLSCGLGRLLGGPTTLSFQGGYERYDDSVYRDSSARGVLGLVRLRVVSFWSRRRLPPHPCRMRGSR